MKDIKQTQHRRFLRKGDLDEELVVTITGVSKEDISRYGEPRKERFVAYFAETEQVLILKWNLAEAIESVTGLSDMDSWVGQPIVVYHDPDVTYNGLKVGGIRVRSASVITE